MLEKVVNLFYYGEIRVLTSLKAKVYKALTFLEVDVPFEAPRPKPIKADFLVVDGQINSDPNHGMCIFVFLSLSRHIYIPMSLV